MLTPTRALVAVGAAVAMLSMCLRASAAAAEPPEWLGWAAPPECQNTAEVERRLQFLLGRPVDFAAVPPTRVRMAWSPETGWAVRVTVELQAGPRSRSLDAPSCADALDVVALSLALILDPGLGGAADEGAAELVTEVPATSLEEASVATSAASQRGAVGAPSSAAPIVAPPAMPAVTDAGVRHGAAAGKGGNPYILSVSGAALADLSTYPVPQFGGGVQVALRRGALRAELEGDLLASESAGLPGALERVSFSTLLGALRACHGAALGVRLVWVSCAGAEVGSLSTHELGGVERRARGIWLASELLMGPEFSATPWLRAFARVRGVTPLIRHEFLLSEGRRVHELPWFGLQLQLGVSGDVMEFGGRGH